MVVEKHDVQNIVVPNMPVGNNHAKIKWRFKIMFMVVTSYE